MDAVESKFLIKKEKKEREKVIDPQHSMYVHFPM